MSTGFSRRNVKYSALSHLLRKINLPSYYIKRKKGAFLIPPCPKKNFIFFKFSALSENKAV